MFGVHLLGYRSLAIIVSVLITTVIGNEINLGTTLVAMKFDGGVVVAADTQTSAGTYVSNKFAKKINLLIDEEGISCAICRSGSAADTQFLAKEAKREFLSRFWRYGFRHPSVAQVAHFLRSKMREENGDRDLQASLICAGYDGEKGGRIFGVALGGGAMWEEDVFCVSGSGSTILLGYLDSLGVKPSSLSSKKDTIDLIEKLLQLSIARDGSSGGFIRMIIMTESGVEERLIYPSPQKGTVELPGFAAPQ